MNTPNKLTVARMLFIIPVLGLLIAVRVIDPLFTYEAFHAATTCFLVAAMLFVIAMATDAIDGHLARRNNQVTTFGKLFDPLADKIMTTGTMLMLAIMGMVPIYLPLIFIIRDTVIDGARNVAAAKGINVAASWWGKSKTILQSLGLILILFIAPLHTFTGRDVIQPDWALMLLNVPLALSAVLAIISGLFYLKPIIPFLDAK